MAREAIGLRVLVIGLVMMATAQIVRPVELPLFDGVVIVEPYRYLMAPPGGQTSPTSAKTTMQVEAGRSPGFAVYTAETPPQAELLAKGGELVLGPGTTSLTVTIDPVSPPAGESSNGIAGNVYRIAVVDQSGTALTLVTGQTIILALRGPDGVAADATIARFNDGTWQPVKSAPSGIHAMFLTDVAAFGDFAIVGDVAPSSSGLDPGILVWAVVAAGLIVLVAWRFGRRSNPIVESNTNTRRPAARDKH